jgi:hypothetical protein
MPSGSIWLIKYWNYATGQYEDTMPTNVPLGQTVGACFYGKNTGSSDQTMYFSMRLKRPDGSEKTAQVTTETVVPPGASIVGETTTITDQAGTWTYLARLWADGSQVDEKSGNAAVVVQPQASGQISQAKYWNYATSQYQTSAPTNVPFGQNIGAVVYGLNNNGLGYNQNMYFVLTLKRPDGTPKKTVTTAAMITPDGSLMTGEIIEAADQAGTWKVQAQLYGDLT